MKLLVRILIYCTYPFLAISALCFAGMGFGMAFITSFTIHNKTDTSIYVTPVGTFGAEGRKAPLPVMQYKFLPLHAFQAGHFRLAPGDSITVSYDMDDINFSEIVVEDNHGSLYQLVTDPKPTENQYHGPLQRDYVIDDLSKLDPVKTDTQAAARSALGRWKLALYMYILLFGPWLIYLPLAYASQRWEKNPDLAKQ